MKFTISSVYIPRTANVDLSVSLKIEIKLDKPHLFKYIQSLETFFYF